jgi:hypothetical protein
MQPDPCEQRDKSQRSEAPDQPSSSDAGAIDDQVVNQDAPETFARKRRARKGRDVIHHQSLHNPTYRPDP